MIGTRVNQVTIVCPVLPGRSRPLVEYLKGLDRSCSPFRNRVPPTHFARFVVLWPSGTDATRRGTGDERPHLFFSARFDGPARAYLDALAAVPAAQEIFDLCDLNGVDARDPVALAAHLGRRRTRLTSQYAVSTIPEGTSVARVNQALALRDELRTFLVGEAATTGGVLDLQRDPVKLIHDLRQLPAVRRLAEAD